MKFGPVSLDQAQGAVLAHSLRLPEGRLRKGAVLTEGDIVRIAEAGIAQVIVAQLEPEDISENDAAQMLARALHNNAHGLRLTAPFTGRVNLVADAPGVVVLDPEQITRANMIDPMLTIATVPNHHQIHPGGLVATVKIISYAVPSRAAKQAAEAAKGAIRLAQPIFNTASLIITDLPGGPGDKGQQAIHDRLAGLGMSLTETMVVPHDETALADAIQHASGEMILILTASATSDIADTAPASLRRAGGQVMRFGIPVDPGNLLFLGELDKRPVIGLPGSARSPVLHGADWILSRVACDVAVTEHDFASMGVGGLLKEIPTRPQPRRPGRAV